MKKVFSQIANTKAVTPKVFAKKNSSYNQQKIKVKYFPHFPTTEDNTDQLSTDKKSNLDLGARMLTEESQNVKRNILKNAFRVSNNNKNQLAISSKNFKKKILNINNTSSNNSGENPSLSKNRSGSEKEKANNSKNVIIRKKKTNDIKSTLKIGEINRKDNRKDNVKEDKVIKENGHIKKVSINLNENCNNKHKVNEVQNKKRVYNDCNINPNKDLNNNNVHFKKVKNDAPAASQVFSSISTFNTLVNINSKERKHMPSSSQIKELNELNQQLQLIKEQSTKTNANSNSNSNSNGHLITSSSNNNNQHFQFNIINAEMLEKDISSIKSPQDKEAITSLTKEMAISSNQRLQTYQLLLNCINSKFNEIQKIVDNDICNRQFNNNINYNRDMKVSELHSKIDFTQEQINLVQNSYDYIDEMQEKSNVIVPRGSNNNITDNITINFIQNFAKRKSIETSIFDFTTELNNSDIIGKNKGECDDKNVISFLSNEMISFFQPSFFIERAETFNNKILQKGSLNKMRIRSVEGSTPTSNNHNIKTIPKMPHYSETQDSIIDQNDEYEEDLPQIAENKLKEESIPVYPTKSDTNSSDKCVIY